VWRCALLTFLILIVPAVASAGLNQPSNFEVLHYDIVVEPNFAAKDVVVIESIRFKSLIDNLETV